MVDVAGEEKVKEQIRSRYGEAALRVLGGGVASCCGGLAVDPVCGNLYSEEEAASAPGEALAASLGCGNPVALAELKPGEFVLDLGCGGGIDVFLAAQRVGPSGRVIGLDMTAEMLALARQNERKLGLGNVVFVRGDMEALPLADACVDVVISNCVINLAPDKDRVLGEAFRVLKPGGRLAVSDIVVRGLLPEEVRRSLELWVGCVAGALEESEYAEKLAAAGFDEIRIEPLREYRAEDAREFLAAAGLDVDAVAAQAKGALLSAFLRARKPDSRR
jgi:SAM-dependent methyltransferase